MNKPIRFTLALIASALLVPAAQAQTSTTTAKKSTRTTKAAPQQAAKTSAPAHAAAATAPTQAAVSPVNVGPRTADYIVAVVNTEPVTNNEVRTRMARAQRQIAERHMTPPPVEELRKQILERLISERAQLQYAKDAGMTVDDAALKQAELSIARQNQLNSIEELHRRIEKEGLNVKEFRDDVRNQVMLARLREREIEPRVKVTDSEVDAFIREQTTGARQSPMELNMAMILVAAPENSSADEMERLRARAEDVAKRARAGEDFAALAREFSDANQRGRDGGVLGLRTADRYPDLFVNSVQHARVGDIVGPVKSGAGFHIIKLLERKQNNELPDVKIPQTRVHHILLRISPTQSEKIARERAADFKRRIESGQISFENLAREQSQDESAADGGDVGWTMPGQFVPELEQVMDNLRVNQISDPVVSRFGVHLIRVDGRREKVLTADEQRQMARNMLREKKAQDEFDTWAKEIRGRAFVDYRDPPT